MKYDFETSVNRSLHGAHKWLQMKDKINKEIPENIVPFSVADMELLCAPEIIRAIVEAAENCNPFGYTRPTTSYYKSVCEWMKKRHNWEIKKDWIVTSDGVIPALVRAVAMLTDKDDSVIIMTPVYYPFYSVITRNGRNITENPLKCINGRYKIDFEDLEVKAADKKCTMLILCNPHNPVGRVWTMDELLKVYEICEKNNVLVVSDEIHFDLISENHKHIPYASLNDKASLNSVTCTSPSKTFNLAGLKTANIIIPNEKIRERYANGKYFMLNVFGYVACEAAYRYCEEWLKEIKILINRNYNIFKNFMNKWFPDVYVYPLEGTYLVWFDCHSFSMSEEELEDFFVNDAFCFLDNGSIFGSAGAGFQRINIACPSKVLEEALERIRISALKRGII